MSSSIDERIVEMQFDNEQFEKNVKTTMNTLDRLNESLEFEGAKTGMRNISDLTRNFDVGDIADAVDSVAERFSALGIIGMRVLENLTDRAIEAGLQFAKSLAIDPIVDGWSKYEASNRSAISLMNNTGESLEYVEEYLDKLGIYADYSSFNLNAMSSALTSFLNSGVSLDEAVPTIMGIANSLTYLGNSAQDSSYAFEIYSKVMANGLRNQQTWRQLTNRGWVNTTMMWEFLEAAEELGTLEKKADGLWNIKGNKKKEVRFEDFATSLSEGWLTAEVAQKVFAERYGKFANGVIETSQRMEAETGLTPTYDEAVQQYIADLEAAGEAVDYQGKAYLDSATLARTYADAVDAVRDAVSSLYKDIFRSIFGDVEKATEFWTAFSEKLNEIVTGPLLSFKQSIESLASQGVFTALKDGFIALFDVVRAVLKPIKDAFNAVFGTLGGDIEKKIYNFAYGFKLWAQNFKLSDETAGKLKDVFTGLFSAIRAGGVVLSWVLELVKPIWDIIKIGAGFILDIAAAIGRLLKPAEDFFEMSLESWFISSPFYNLTVQLQNVKKDFEAVIGNWDAFVNRIRTEGIKMEDVFRGIGAIVGGIGMAFVNVFSSLTGWDKTKFTEKMEKFAEDADAFIIEKCDRIREIFANTFGEDATIFSIAGKVLSEFIGLIEKLGQKLIEWIPDIKAGLKSLFSKEENGDIEEGAKTALKASDIFKAAFNAIKTAIDWLRPKILEFFGGKITLETIILRLKDIADLLLTLNLSSFLKKTGDFFDNLGGIVQKFAKSISAGAIAIKTAAAGILMIVGAMVILAALKPAALAQSAAAMTGIVIAIAALAKIISSGSFGDKKKLLEASASITVLAIAIDIIAAAIAKLANADGDNLTRAFWMITGLVVILGVMQKFERAVDGIGFNKSMGQGILLMSVSMFLIAEAFKQLGELDKESMDNGLAVMWSIMLGMTMLTAVSGIAEKDINLSPKAFLTIATSLTAIAYAIKLVGDIEDPMPALKTLGIMVGIIGAAITVMQLASKAEEVTTGKFKATKSGASFESIGKAFIIMSVGLLAIAGALKLMDGIDDVGTNMLALIEMILIMTVALGAMYGITAAMKGGSDVEYIASAFIKMAAAITILGAAFVVMGKAENVGVSCAVLAGSIVVLLGAAALIGKLKITAELETLAKVFTGFGIAIAGAGVGIVLLTAAIVPFLTQLALATPIIFGILTEMLVGLGAFAFEVITLVGTLLVAIADQVIKFIPKAMEAVTLIFLALIDLFYVLLPQLALFLVKGIYEILNTIDKYSEIFANQICNICMHVLTAVVVWIGTHSNDIYELLKIAVLTIANLIYSLIGNGVADLVGTFFPKWGNEIREGVDILTDGVSEEIKAAQGKMSTAAGITGQNAGESLNEGLSSTNGSFIDTATTLLGSFQNPIKEFGLPGGVGEMLGFKSIGGSVSGGIDKFIGTGAIDAKGETVTHQFADGLSSDLAKEEVKDAAGNVTAVYWSAVGTSATQAKAAMDEYLKGIVAGLRDKARMKEIEEAGAHIGAIIDKSTRNELLIKSPSKKGIEIGKFFDEGIKKGLDDYVPEAEAEDLGKRIINAVSKPLQAVKTLIEDGSFDPVITPKLDLSQLAQGVSQMSSMVSGTGAVINTTGITTKTSAAISAYTDTGTSKTAPQQTSITNNYNFTQNNTSPKALDRTEIYRQTNNQFASLKNATKTGSSAGGGGKLVQMAR